MATQQELIDKLIPFLEIIEPGGNFFQQVNTEAYIMEITKYNDLLEQCADHEAAEDDEIGQLIKGIGLKYREILENLKDFPIN